jgi:hypothetical protein
LFVRCAKPLKLVTCLPLNGDAFQEVGPVLVPHRCEQLSLFGPTYEAHLVGVPELSGVVLGAALSVIAWLAIGCLIWVLA